MHAIVFANRDRGNQLYDRTPGFPEDAAARIYEICITHGAPKTIRDTTPVLRYQPLAERFLLTVIHRLPQGNDMETRAHVVCVNFLMDEQEADHFFRIPFPEAAQAVIENAQTLMKLRAEKLPPHLCGEFLQLHEEDAMPCRGQTPLAILMMGASYCLERKRTNQLYLQSSLPAIGELHNLLRVVPPPLRKRLSFHTGCISARECRSLGICYCHEDMLTNILASDFEGGPNTTKYWYFAHGKGPGNRIDDRNRTLANRLIQIPEQIPLYDLLRDAVTDWDIYRELSLLINGHPRLEEVLEQLPEEDVLQIIRSGQASDLQLAQLAKAADSGSPIRKAAKAARGKTPPSSHRPSRLPPISDVYRSIRKFLHQNRDQLMLILSILIAALNYSAVDNGIGDDLIREILCFVGVFGTGFFVRAIRIPSKGSNSDSNQ